jgi:CubicO group peptidase (beta-lactamase class C family)
MRDGVNASQLDRFIAPLVGDAGLVGCAVGVVRGGHLIYANGFGTADLKTKQSADEHTSYRIGSISKTFTAVGIMQLRERGLVDLDEPITRYLRSLDWNSRAGFRPPTLREVMTHVAGVGEVLSWGDVRKPLMGLAVKRGAPVPPMGESYPRGITPEIAPGQKWAYSNHAVAALGQVVEDVAGQPFHEYMTQHVFTPLGMMSTDFQVSDRVGSLATGYRSVLGRRVTMPWYDLAVPPAGAAISSIADMGKFAAALMGSGTNDVGTMLLPASVEEMFRCQWAPHSRLPSQGLIFLLDDIDGHRIVWHDGTVPGFAASMLVAPDDELAVVVLSNSTKPTPHGVAEAVLRMVLGCPSLIESVTGAAVPPSPQIWPQIVGSYAPERGPKTNLRHVGLFGNELSVHVHGGRLVASGLCGPLARGVALHPCSPDNPYAFEGVAVSAGAHVPTRVRLVFVPDEAGRAQTVAGQLMLPFKFSRKPAWRSLRTAMPLGLRVK